MCTTPLFYLDVDLHENIKLWETVARDLNYTTRGQVDAVEFRSDPFRLRKIYWYSLSDEMNGHPEWTLVAFTQEWCNRPSVLWKLPDAST